MSWNVPVPATTGELYTAARYNTDVIDNLNTLKISIANDGKLASTGGVLTSPELKGYLERTQPVTISSGSVVISAILGNHVTVPLTSNITSFTVNNLPASGLEYAVMVYFTADGTPRTVTHTVNTHAVKFPNAATPTMSSVNGKIDRIVYSTIDAGATWLGDAVGQSY